MKQKLPLILVLLIFLSSCTLVKRNYRAGYYVAFKSKAANGPVKKQTTGPDMLPVHESDLTVKTPLPEVTASLKGSPSLSFYSRPGNETTGCDSIFLRNGDIILARVAEINPEEVKYKNCNNPDGPMYVIEKKTISRVTYSNGTTETFSAPENTDRTSREWKTTDEIKRARGEASDAFVFSLISFPAMLFYLTGIVLAVIAIIKARRAIPVLMRNPKENFKSIQQARNAITIACIAIGLVVALLALLVVLLLSM